MRRNILFCIIHPEFSKMKEKSFLHDSCEMKEKKSEIFSLSFHNYRVKKISPSQTSCETGIFLLTSNSG
jgi:hypothetical protein